MHRSLRRPVMLLAATVVSIAGAAACSQGEPTPQPAAASSTVAPAPAVAAKFKALGSRAPITVLPARLAGAPMPQVGRVVAMFLEKAGMTELETSDAAFNPPEGADIAHAAEALGEFVRANPQPTEYTLFADMLGTHKAGITQVRTLIVDKQGALAWADDLTKGQEAFDRASIHEPMDACLLVANRLRPVLALGDPAAGEAHGKIADQFRKASGVPDKAELDAIEQRTAAFRKAAAKSTVLIYPPHAGDAPCAPCARDIAAQVNAAKLTGATASDSAPKFAIAADMNEQKVLWSMARAFSAHVKANPPEADYALFADYIMGKNNIGAVHFAICDKHGELVAVDFQNNHHTDFNAVSPKTADDCAKLVVKRLTAYCK